MGTWGSGLYENDLTCDVKDTYLKKLMNGIDDKKACQSTIHEYSDLDKDEEALFWFALAQTQWSVGRLLDEVKNKAIMYIEQDGSLELWASSADKGDRWGGTLNELKMQLESPMRPKKKFSKPKIIDVNLWNVNDVYAYQFHTENSKEHGVFGKYILMQKIGESKKLMEGSLMMRVQVIDKVFDNIPTLKSINDYRILPFDSPRRFNISKDTYSQGGRRMIKKVPIKMSLCLFLSYKKDYPKDYLTYIGNIQGPLNLAINQEISCIPWGNIDDSLSEIFAIWQGLEYDTIAEGIYDYNKDKDKNTK